MALFFPGINSLSGFLFCLYYPRVGFRGKSPILGKKFSPGKFWGPLGIKIFPARIWALGEFGGSPFCPIFRGIRAFPNWGGFLGKTQGGLPILNAAGCMGDIPGEFFGSRIFFERPPRKRPQQFLLGGERHKKFFFKKRRKGGALQRAGC